MAREDWESPLDERALGERVRLLRRSAGLSQSELAAGRFSKEYVSQIERGKTRPTRETLDWLADRLHTDPEYLEHGLTRADADAWAADLRALGEAGEYFFSVNRYLFMVVKPGRPSEG